MEIIVNPQRAEWPRLCERNIPADDDIERTVTDIISEVREDGDDALLRFARKFDRFEGSSLILSEKEIDERAAMTSPAVGAAIRKAAANIEAFHRAQTPETVECTTAPGVTCIQKAVPIERIGLYIPGGRAPLFSTVLMLAIPARIAGCRKVVLCTPDGQHGIAPEILFAAKLCGIRTVVRAGGAQAIAAMAFGTESVPKVDKIFGPGNRYVTKAKQLMSRFTAIDMPAGPSEVMVLADRTAYPEYVAADMLSQAEHGPDSQAITVCDSEDVANAVAANVEKLAAGLPRRDSIEGSLSHSRIIVITDREIMLDFANTYAPEHLIISLSDPWKAAGAITAAGSVFIGNYSPESAGDYASGTNHTLPTSGWARSFSGVNLDSFMHKITFQEITPEGLCGLAPVITTMAHAEGLDAHALAVDVRCNGDSPKETDAIEDSFDVTKLIRKNILALEPYSTARDEFKGGDISMWLDANESPYPNGVNRYPDPHQKKLRQRISEMTGMPVESVFVGGAGSDEAIDLVYRIFCEPGRDNAVAISPSYGVYEVSAAVNDIEFRKVQLNEDFSLPVDRILEAADRNTKLIWICSPNNPTGNAFPAEEILEIADKFRGIVVVDEAYVDFSDKGSLLRELNEHKNIIVLRTFSKAWGMAAMRAGMAFGAPEIMQYFGRVKYPYNMSQPIQDELLRRIGEGTGDHIAEIRRQARIMAEELPKLPCVLKVYPTDANFILVKVTDADAIYDYLTDNGAIVRNRSRIKGCESCLRITVGTPEECRRTIELLKNYRP